MRSLVRFILGLLLGRILAVFIFAVFILAVFILGYFSFKTEERF